MKKRRNLIIPLMLVVALVVGIGYAFETRELAIGGMAQLSSNDSAFDVSFVKAEVAATNADTAPVNPEIVTDTTARYTITGLAGADDFVVMKFIVQNKTSDVTAVLSGLGQTRGSIILGNGATENSDVSVISQYFNKTVTMYHSNENGEKISSGFTAGVAEVGDNYVYDAGNQAQALVLAPAEYATVEVRVELQKTLGANGVPAIVTLNGATITLDFDDITLTPAP